MTNQIVIFSTAVSFPNNTLPHFLYRLQYNTYVMCIYVYLSDACMHVHIYIHINMLFTEFSTGKIKTFLACSYPFFPKMCPFRSFRYGPLVRHWTMRYEAKHSYFKTLAHTLGNFTNISYSLAMRHQQHVCYLLNRPKGNDITTGQGNRVVILLHNT